MPKIAHGTTNQLCPMNGGNIKVSFCPVPTPEVQAEILVTSVTNAETPAPNKTDKKEQGERSKFEP